MCLRNLFRRRIRTFLSVLGIALGVIPIVAVGATTTRYFSIIKEMNLLYSGDVVVVAKGSIFIQAVPIGGSLQENIVNKVKQVEGVKTAVPMLCVIGLSTYKYSLTQLVPLNVSVGMPPGNWSFLVGSGPRLLSRAEVGRQPIRVKKRLSLAHFLPNALTSQSTRR